MTLQELNKLKKALSVARTLKAKIDRKKKSVDSSSPNTSGMPSARSDKADIIASYLDDEKELKKLYASIFLKNRAALAYIDNIEDDITKLIFRYRFIDGLEWKTIALEMGGGNEGSIKQTVYRHIKSNP